MTKPISVFKTAKRDSYSDTSDVVKALALGADFVFAGRPFLFAVAAGGYSGVSHAIDLLASEIDRTIALLGCSDLYNLRTRIV